MFDGPRRIQWIAVAMVIVALIGGVVKLYLGLKKSDGSEKQYVSGTVIDTVSKKPLAKVPIELQTDDGRQLTRDRTDSEGRFNLEVPSEPQTIRVIVSAKNYRPYDKKLPAHGTLNDIELDPLGKSWGFAENSPIDQVLEQIATDLNITIVFKSCARKARGALLNEGQVEQDSKSPIEIAREVISHLKASTLKLSIADLNSGRRLEVTCH